MKRILLAGVAVVVAFTAACAPAHRISPAEQAIRDTIVRYNNLLADGYRALNMNKMLEVATNLQAQDEYIHMSSLAEGGVRLDPTLKRLTFVKVSIESTTAQVETRETWDYKHYSRSTGALLLVQKDLIYDLAYDLQKQSNGGWLVSDIRAISATSTVAPDRIATPTPGPVNK